MTRCLKVFFGRAAAVDEIWPVSTKPLSRTEWPVVCGTSYRNRECKNLGAIVDYLPAPTDILQSGGGPEHGKEIERHSSDSEPFSALALKSRPTLMSVSSVLPRLLRLNQGWRDRLQLQQGHERAFRPHTSDAFQSPAGHQMCHAGISRRPSACGTPAQGHPLHRKHLVFFESMGLNR